MSTTTTTTLANLRAQGVAMPMAQQLAASYDTEHVQAWTDYAARQQGMGAGALIVGIRSGDPPPTRPKSVLAQQAEYGRSIQAWLAKNFPEYDRPKWGPHPAAVAEVIRLHWRHGKGSLTKEEHGPAIHAAVERWEAEAEPDRLAELSFSAAVEMLNAERWDRAQQLEEER
jgi:hypothetical protein